MTAKSHGDDRLRVVGSDGILEVTNSDPLQTVGKQVVLTAQSRPAETLPLSNPGQLFVDSVTALRADSQPRVTTQDALTITDLCLHARHAADNRGDNCSVTRTMKRTS